MPKILVQAQATHAQVAFLKKTQRRFIGRAEEDVAEEEEVDEDVDAALGSPKGWKERWIQQLSSALARGVICWDDLSGGPEGSARPGVLGAVLVAGLLETLDVVGSATSHSKLQER
ncbi:hypothetical protein CYMTET_53437 [Cymbomonas tetramitiformis]|uniref:Uncharacterized protein n=1 Tax=Cymbomonas tetramitiformis TaxID=36881 RepID=A0AAE0BH19_9CHLO|nr:hypothetical protein CYMTET_53437 [Cymbomonas tetramitiformis]